MTINPKHMPMYDKYSGLKWFNDPMLMMGNQSCGMEGFGHARDFFASLGIHNYTSLDLDGGDIQLDLNSPQPSLYQKYKTVINIGTLEHVWDNHNAWSNALAAVMEGGMLISVHPDGGWHEHGINRTVPKWIAHFCELNGFRVRDRFVMPGLPENRMAHVLAAEKMIHVTNFVKPMEVKNYGS